MSVTLKRPRLVTWAVLAAVGLAPKAAAALDFENVGGEALTLDITNTATAAYAFDNGDSSDLVTATPSTIVNDTYGEVLDRLNVQAYYWRLRAGVRLDVATYFGQLTDDDIEEISAEQLPNANGPERNDYGNGLRRELHTRYRHTIYPAKLFLGYTAPSVDITVGDFYAQFGRGLVLSVRKIDELATDTTVRGMKAAFKKSWEDSSLSVTAVAGQMNPVRIDEQSGRRLNGDGSPLFFGFPEADDFEYFTFDNRGQGDYVTAPARPSYLEDSLFGLSVEAGPKQVLIGGHASLLSRKSYADENALCRAADGDGCDDLYPVFATNNASRLRDTILTASGSVNVPSLWDIGDVYVEAAGQHATDGRASSYSQADGFSRADDHTGYAVYGAATLRGGPITVSLEGKHYSGFLPLSGNVSGNGATDATFSAPEFDGVSYNQVPTVEPIYTQQFGAANTCVTGGRAKADYRVADDLSVYGWTGFYSSLTEFNPLNVDCDTSTPGDRTNTIDAASGADLTFEKGKTIIKAWIGLRDTRHDEAVQSANQTSPSDVFYREGYIRYDLLKHLAGDFSLQSQGFHRHRYEPQLSGDSWNEGENYLALRWAPYVSFIFGYEYLGRRGCVADPDTELCHYFSGGIQFKAADREYLVEQIFDTVNLFVGQRRGAIRCVSGVCRNFPPFQGAKLEITSRF